MSASMLCCPVCRQPLQPNAHGEARCASCTASFRMLLMPEATLTLPAETVTHSPAGPGATITYQPSPTGEPCDERAPPGYEILGELGRGGMGVVYRARHARLDRHCALKMILAGGHAGERERKRFETEARAIARLQHPGIVQVFEVGEHQGHPFMALELCEGGSLDARLRDQPPTAKQAATIVRDLAVAMQAAHEAKVIHRDLKPGNVLLAARGRLKITDFGLAKKLDTDEGQTRTGAIMGTPSYMSPEQAHGAKDLGPAVDIYALGAILYAALTGRPPFRGATVPETLRLVVETDPVAVRELNPGVPRDLETIVHKCLRKDPLQRYASTQALAEDLGRFLQDEPIIARPVGRLERAAKWVRRNPIVSALASAVILVLAAGILVSWAFASEAARQAKDATEYAKKADDNAKEASDRADSEARAKGHAQHQRDKAEYLLYIGNMAQAQRDFNEGEGALAIRSLERCRWDLRSWEHRHLWSRFNSRQILWGHAGGVRSVAFSPDGKRILTGSGDKTARVWDAGTGLLLLTLAGHSVAVSSVAWSPDGNLALTGGGESNQAGEVKVWDATSGKQVLSAAGHTEGVTSLAWSPDGQRFATAALDKTCRIWDANTGQEIVSFNGHTASVLALAWSPDGNRIVSGGYDATARIWSATTGQELLVLKHGATVLSVAWNPDGKRIVTSEFYEGLASEKRIGRLTLWDAATGKPLQRGPVSQDRIRTLAWSPDGQQFLTGGWLGRATVWKADSGQEVQVFPQTSTVLGVAWSPNGSRVVTGCSDGTARIWDTHIDQALATFQDPGRSNRDEVRSVAWSPDSTQVALGLGNYPLVWEPGRRRAPVRLTGRGYRNNTISSLGWSPDGTRLLVGSDTGLWGPPLSGEVRMWDVMTGKLNVVPPWSGSVYAVAWSPDGARIALGYGDNAVRVWDSQTRRFILTWKPHNGKTFSLAYSPDGKQILTSGGNDEARVWDAETKEERLNLQGHKQPIYSVAWSPNGARIALGSNDTIGTVWDANTGKMLFTLEGHTDIVTSVGWSPDSKRIVTGSADRTLRIWDAARGQNLLTLKEHAADVLCVAWSPDGRSIASGSQDQTAKVWSADRGQAVFRLPCSLNSVHAVAFDAGTNRLFAWDKSGSAVAWSLETGLPEDPVNSPTMPSPGVATSAVGTLVARVAPGSFSTWDTQEGVEVVHRRQLEEGNRWPLPDQGERRRYHTEQADAAEKAGQWFAVAFHIGRLLLDDPENAELKKRRDEAFQKHAAK